MNAQQINCFLAVAETLSFSTAAQRLYLTQPTVSYQVKSLEKELDCRLFIRSTASTTLTETGRRLIGPARTILAGIQEAERIVRDGRGVQGTLRMLVPPTMILVEENTVFRPMIQALEAACGTAVKCQPMEAVPSEAAGAMARGEVDLMIVEQGAARAVSKLVRIHPLFVSAQYVMLHRSHPLADRSVICPEDLAGETVLLSNEDTCFSPAMREACARRCAAIAWRGIGSYKLALTFVSMNEGVCLSSLRMPLPEGVVIRDFDSGAPQNICLMGTKAMPIKVWEAAVFAVDHVFRGYGERR